MMNKIHWRESLAVFAAFLLLLPLSLGNPEMHIKVLKDGSGDVEMSDSIDYPYQSSSLSLTASESGEISFSELTRDDSLLSVPDYLITLKVSEGNFEGNIAITGQYVKDLLSLLGDFEAEATVRNQDGIVHIDGQASLSGYLFEEVTLLDHIIAREDPRGTQEFINNISNVLLFGNLAFDSKPSFSLTSFSMTGSDPYEVTFSAEIRNWEGFLQELRYSYEADVGTSQLPICLGQDFDRTFLGILSSNFGIIFSVQASGDSMSFSARSSSPPIGYSSLNVTSEKTLSERTTSMQVTSANIEDFGSCFVSPELFLLGEARSFEYLFTKNPESNTGLASFTANFNSLGKPTTIGGEIRVPQGLTSIYGVTVNAPSGMSILSVEGGQKTGDSSAVSTGGDFTVTYGKAGADYTMWIIAAIVIIPLLVLSRRGKKK